MPPHPPFFVEMGECPAYFFADLSRLDYRPEPLRLAKAIFVVVVLVLVGLGFELRTLNLQSRHYTV
jgi:hypothetical protein